MTEWSKLSSWATVQQGHTGQVRRPCALTHCFSLELHQRVQVCVDTVWYVDRVWQYIRYIHRTSSPMSRSLWRLRRLRHLYTLCYRGHRLRRLWLTRIPAYRMRSCWRMPRICIKLTEVLLTYAAYEVLPTYAASTYATALHRIKFEALETVAKTLVSRNSG
jgi:hypothetical protein